MQSDLNEIPLNQIKILQEYIVKKGKERGFSSETLHERLLILVEEIGELMKAVRKTDNGFLDKSKDNDADLEGEISDILTMLFWTAHKLNVDVSKAFKKKEKENNKRVWKRSAKLSKHK